MPEYVKVARRATLNLTTAGWSRCKERRSPCSTWTVSSTPSTTPVRIAGAKVSTGEVLSLPAPQAVGSYKVRVNGPDIELGL